MATFVQISDKAAAWEYMQGGLLYSAWKGGTPTLRTHNWNKTEWQATNFDGYDARINYILVEE